MTFGEFIQRHIKITLGSILLLAFFLRLFSILFLKIVPSSDALDYHQLACNLVEFGRYEFHGMLTAYRPPGFPFFLSAIYFFTEQSLFAAQIAQAVLETIQCLFLFILGKKLFSPLVGCISACFWASYPVSVIQSNFLMSEPLLGCLLLGSVVLILSDLFSSKTGIILLGIVWGCAALTKPFFILAPFPLIIWMLWRRTSFKKIILTNLAIMVVMGCVTAPWLFRNIYIFHKPMISSNGGVNFWIGNNDNASGGLRVDLKNDPFENIHSEVELDSAGYALGRKFISARPLDAIKLVPKKFAHLFSSESPFAVYLKHRPLTNRDKRYATLYIETPLFSHLAFNLHYVFFMFTGILGLFFMQGKRASEAQLMLLFIASWIGIHLIFFGSHRFHYPLMPFFVLASAYLITNFKQIEFKAQLWKMLIAVAFIIGFIAIILAEVLTVIARGTG